MDRLAAWVALHPRAIVATTAALALLAALWSARNLRLDADTNSLVGDDQPYMRAYREFLRDFGDLEFILVVVDPRGNQREADHAIHELVEQLGSVAGLRGVTGWISAAEQCRLSSWSMTDEELAGLHLARGALTDITASTGAGGLLQSGSERLERLLSDGAGMEPARQRALAAESFLLIRCALGGMPEAPPSLASPLAERWLPTADGSLRLVLVMPEKDFQTLAVIEEPLARMREAIARVQRAHPSIEIGLTGKPVLQADEMRTTNDDMNAASVIALALCAMLFMAVFRGVRRPALAVVVFLAGSALTYGAATLMLGRLNLLSVVFMLVLVGVGLDYGVHMVARYLEGLRHLGPAASVRHTIRQAVPSVLSGALTSAGTFLIAVLAPMRGLRELGLVSGVGLLLCAVTMAIALPALLLIADRGARRAPLNRGLFMEPLDRQQDRFGGRAATRHWVLATIFLVLALAGGWWGWRQVRFESNLLRLQADGLQSVGWQRRLQAAGGNATWFGACVTGSIDSIQPLLERARTEPLIGQTRSVLDLVRADTPQRAEMRTAIGQAALARQTSSRQIATPALADRAASALDRLADGAGIAGAPEADVASIRALRDATRGLNQALRERPDETVRAAETASARAAEAATALGKGARGALREALPQAVRETFASASGRFAVTLSPVEDVWEPESLERFVAAMRRVDPSVTGVPITVLESLRIMKASFVQQALLATAFVALVLLVDFRSPRLAALSLSSLAAGIGLTVGAMAALDVPFSLANFFAIPIMIGLGVDSCIHVTHRAVDGGLLSGFGSTRRAVVVTALTTTIGFGTLLWAEHRGLRSLGAVMTIASLACLASSVWLLPALLRIAGLGAPRRSTAPTIPPCAT
jgi:predicted RND superfamily exporter protein